MKRAALAFPTILPEERRAKPGLRKNRFFEIPGHSLWKLPFAPSAIVVLNYLTVDNLVSINNALVELFKLISGLIGSDNR